jgi:hypothetical protein
MSSPEKTAKKQAGQFKKGQSGNPNGRPVGSRNRTTLAVEALLDGEAENLTRKAIQLALAGDMTALRICLERISPPRKDRPVTFALPHITKASEAAQASAAVVQAVASGDVTPSEAAEITKIIQAFATTLQVADFEARLAALEQREAA